MTHSHYWRQARIWLRSPTNNEQVARDYLKTPTREHSKIYSVRSSPGQWSCTDYVKAFELRWSEVSPFERAPDRALYETPRSWSKSSPSVVCV
jgi:hypothetical protein